MDYNFKKFERAKKVVPTMKIYDTLVSVKGLKQKKGTMIDIYLDNKKNAIKIVPGNTYVLSEVSKNRLAFSASALRRAGLKKGCYTSVADNIFVLEKEYKSKPAKALPKEIVDVEGGTIDYGKLRKWIKKDANVSAT